MLAGADAHYETMPVKRIFLAALAALAVGSPTGHAQMGGPPQTGFNAALTKLFGPVTAFSASCELRVLDSQGLEKMVLPMQFAVLDGRFRADVDMTRGRGRDLSAEQIAAMQQTGMGRVISIARPDKKSLYLLLPAAQAAVTLPMSEEEVAALQQSPKLEQAVLGTETLDGHPCEKRRVTMTDSAGQSSEVLLWAARDLKDFPIQIQTKERGDTFVFRYSNLRLVAPEAELFDVPAAYTTYASMQAFTVAMLKKALEGGAKP